mgnify:CR=1 FL=1
MACTNNLVNRIKTLLLIHELVGDKFSIDGQAIPYRNISRLGSDFPSNTDISSGRKKTNKIVAFTVTTKKNSRCVRPNKAFTLVNNFFH